jgi:curved DNA-binding protein CbpA
MAPVDITDDYYAIVEVPNTATLEVIKKSYRRLAIALHPDKNPHKPDATASFQLVTPPRLN